MKKKLTIALVIVISALTIAFSPSAAAAEECPDVYVQPASCNESNPPAKVTFEPVERLATTGDEIDWTGLVVGGILLLGGTLVIVDQATRKFGRTDTDRLEEEEEG